MGVGVVSSRPLASHFLYTLTQPSCFSFSTSGPEGGAVPLMGVLQGLARKVTRTVLLSREAPAASLCRAPAKAPVTCPCAGRHRSAALSLHP